MKLFNLFAYPPEAPLEQPDGWTGIVEALDPEDARRQASPFLPKGFEVEWSPEIEMPPSWGITSWPVLNAGVTVQEWAESRGFRVAPASLIYSSEANNESTEAASQASLF